MDVKGPAMLGSIETQLMASMLSYGIQFLDPLPDDHQQKLALELVRDMRTTQNGAVFDQSKVEQLTGSCFDRGRIYEILPEDALVRTEELGRSATLLFLEKVPLKLAEDTLADLKRATVARLAESPTAADGERAVCQLFWLWFQWGRSYQKGNEHPPQTPLS